MRISSKQLLVIFSWLITLVWTAVLVYLLMKPGSDSALAQPFLSSFFRLNFSRVDLIEAVAHIGMFGSLMVLWWWVLVRHYPARYAVTVVVLLGMATEFGQYFVARSSIMLDLMANFTGIALSFAALHFLSKRIAVDRTASE